MQTSKARGIGQLYFSTATAGTAETAWVVDAGMSTGHSTRDVGEYARRISDTLARSVGTAPAIDPQSLVDSARQVPGKPGMAASIAVARRTPLTVEYAVLGMCAVVARTAAGELEVVQDRQWAEVTREQRAHVATALSMAIDTRPGRASLAAVTRDRRNTPGGYWCFNSWLVI